MIAIIILASLVIAFILGKTYGEDRIAKKYDKHLDEIMVETSKMFFKLERAIEEYRGGQDG